MNKFDNTTIKDFINIDTFNDTSLFAISVIDLENFEVVYINQSMKNIMADLTAKNCWEAIYGQSSPCMWCKAHILQNKLKQDIHPSQSKIDDLCVTYENFNEAADKWYQVQEKVIKLENGKEVLISFSIDISLQKEEHSQLINTHVKLRQQTQALEEAKNELKDLNNNLKIKIEKEVEKNIQKELELFEQSKTASLGAMIGNISHQMKQPLNIISSTAQNINLEQNMNILNLDSLSDEMNIIIKQAQYLSKSIDTFRNFLMTKKELKEVILQDEIDTALNVVSLLLEDNHIQLKNNIDYTNQIKITLFVGELQEVIINIINNASDILMENEVNNPWVQIDLKQTNTKAIVTIEDNAGGIPENIIDKVFDKYFTTKGKESGTGLGLHMSKIIIQDSLKGSLYVKNTKNGAKFFIELPLES